MDSANKSEVGAIPKRNPLPPLSSLISLSSSAQTNLIIAIDEINKLGNVPECRKQKLEEFTKDLNTKWETYDESVNNLSKSFEINGSTAEKIKLKQEHEKLKEMKTKCLEDLEIFLTKLKTSSSKSDVSHSSKSTSASRRAQLANKLKVAEIKQKSLSQTLQIEKQLKSLEIAEKREELITKKKVLQLSDEVSLIKAQLAAEDAIGSECSDISDSQSIMEKNDISKWVEDTTRNVYESNHSNYNRPSEGATSRLEVPSKNYELPKSIESDHKTILAHKYNDDHHSLNPGLEREHKYSLQVRREEPYNTASNLNSSPRDSRVRWSEERPVRSTLNPSAEEFSYADNTLPSIHEYERARQTTLDASSRYLAIMDLKRSPAVPYNGDSYIYHTWMASLVNKMAPLKLDPSDQIEILEAHTIGEPRNVVQTFKTSHALNPKLAVEIIVDKLEKRFGAEEEISNELRQRLNRFPEIRGSEDDVNVAINLRKLSDLCTLISAHMSTVHDLKTFNQPSGLQVVRAKLPTFVNNRWRNVKSNYYKRTMYNPDFDYFCNFLEEYSENLCADLVPRQSMSRGRKTSSEINTLTTSVSECNEISGQENINYFLCPLHRSNTHDLQKCFLFVDLKYRMKKQLISNYQLCFKCLGRHLIRNCTEVVQCATCNSEEHVTVMHHSAVLEPKKRTNYNSLNIRNSEYSLCTSVCGVPDGRNCGKTVLVEVSSNSSHKKLITYAIIDEQSTNSLATSHLFDHFNLNTDKYDYRISTVTSHQSRITGRIANDLLIRGIDQNEIFTLPKLYEANFIPDTKSEVATREIVEKIPAISHYACNFPLINNEAHVSLLIGRDAGNLMCTKVINDTTPVLHKTPIGFALVGNVCPSYVNRNDITTMRTSISHDHYDVKDLFPDNKGIFGRSSDDDLDGLSVNDKKFLNIIENNVTVNSEGSIEMPLPLKNELSLIPNNCKPVYNRQKNTIQQLKKDHKKLTESVKFMQNLIDSKHVEIVPDEELNVNDGRTWYLPVFPVIHPKKRKLRLVFDSAASYAGVSLNSFLLQGPDQNNKLRGVLLRFREDNIGFVADVASMFHCFSVNAEYRDFLRFFWPKGNDMRSKLITYRARVHIFGNTCSPSIATIGLRKAADSLLNEPDDECNTNTKTRNYIHKNFYVDDGLGCASTVKEAVTILKKSKETLARYNIVLHKIVCNDQEVLNAFPKCDRGDTSSIFHPDDDTVHRTLGVAWNTTTDHFTIKVDIPDRPFTKRGILAVIGSIYDPIGLASPVVLGGRLIQRKILPRKNDHDSSISSYGWDDELPPNLLKEWINWKESLISLSNLKLPRCLKRDNFGAIIKRTMHVFSDASDNSIGHCIYLQCENEHGNMSVSFLYGESKVSPKAATSIPRLELCAAVVASQSAIKIRKELTNKPSSITFYTDSRIVLGYVRNTTRRFSNYVSRRVEMILNVSSPTEWTYISTERNPADIATRPMRGEALLASCWLSGPPFLRSDETENLCPENPMEIEQLPELLPEISCSLVLQTDNCDFSLAANRFSSWTRFIRVIEMCMKITKVWIAKLKQTEVNKETYSYKKATNFVLRNVQEISFKEIFIKLKKDGTLPISHPLASLSVFIDDDGFLKVGGRLRNIEASCIVKFPLLLPADNTISNLILTYYHERSGHQGRHITHGALREAGFYIVKANKAIKSLINKCVTCRRLRASCEQQLMSDLPIDRLTVSPPFNNTGLDVFGHWFIHDGTETRRSPGTKKVWAVLFTCLYSRAVHIEPLPSLDTTSFQNSLRRFLAIRGPCQLIRSDRGTNFQSTSKDINFLKIGDFLLTENCKWEFNPPHASHFGGVWERKIGQVRRAMDAAILKTSSRTLSRDELYTFLQEAANIVNSTPLWDISEDPNDPQPMSPSMLLTHKGITSVTEEFSECDLLSYGKKRWRRVQYVADIFWKQWRLNYLESLRTRQKWLRDRTPLAKGDIVLIREKNVKRNLWPFGKVENVNLSKDGRVRSVKIKVVKRDNKNHKTYYYERPVSELVLLIRAVDS